MIVPDSRIILLKTPFEIDKRNQLTFNNVSQQYNYFSSLTKLEYDECSYQKKDKVIRFITGNEPGRVVYEDLLSYNYCMYQNTNYSNKWFYAYIDNIEYKNDGLTEISISTDSFQTWQFDINYKRSFVEREHVNNDSIGLHTIPEGLELGDYISCKPKEHFLDDPSDFYVCMSVTELPDESIPSNVKTRNYNSVFGGLYYLAFKTFTHCENAIKIYDLYSKRDAIQSIFMVPKQLQAITTGSTATWTATRGSTTISCQVVYLEPISGEDTILLDSDITAIIPDKLGENYTNIKNNKLFTFPFSYLNVTNNAGITEVFRYENMSENDITNKKELTFDLSASITPGMSMKLIPLFYKNVNINYNEGITLGKLPICNWVSDTYTNWLTQNGLNNAISISNSLLNTVVSTSSGNVSGASSGVTGIFSSLQERRNAQLAPNQARGNTNNGDINFSYENDGGISFYYMSIRDEMAEVIDNYFSMFGYKVNTVKIPNITGRPNWNYVKTIDINITGDIPQKDLQDIRDIFNNGVTFWHNPNTFLDYSQNNK